MYITLTSIVDAYVAAANSLPFLELYNPALSVYDVDIPALI